MIKKILFYFLYLITLGVYAQTNPSKSIDDKSSVQTPQSNLIQVVKKNNVNISRYIIEPLPFGICSPIQSNNNFANATNMTIPSTLNSQTTCGTLEPGENTGCAIATQSVWYKFTASAATTFISITNTTSSCYLSSAIWSTTNLPAAGNYCGMESCQSAYFGPTITLYELNTVTGSNYHIQVMFDTAACGSNATFNVAVSNSNPGGTITNLSTQSPHAPTPICYICTASPTCISDSNCTVYPLTLGTGLMENIVQDVYYNFNTGNNCSTNASFQDCILSTCTSGNITWEIWQLYDATGNTCITSGTVSTLTVSNISCNTGYVVHFLSELYSCSYTSHTPFIDNNALCPDSVKGVVNGIIKVNNAFSPNGDGLNETFIIDNIEEFTANHVYIYNRWGQLLWNKSGYNNVSVVWNGKDNSGNNIAAGTYFYIIENVGGKTLKGWVELTK